MGSNPTPGTSAASPALKVVGRRLDPDDYRLRDFLTRAAQPHDFLGGAVGEGSMAVALAHHRLDELAGRS